MLPIHLSSQVCNLMRLNLYLVCPATCLWIWIFCPLSWFNNALWKPNENSTLHDLCLVLTSSAHHQQLFQIITLQIVIFTNGSCPWSDWSFISIASGKTKQNKKTPTNFVFKAVKLNDNRLRWPQTKGMTFCLKGRIVNTRLYSTGKWKYLKVKNLHEDLIKKKQKKKKSEKSSKAQTLKIYLNM